MCLVRSLFAWLFERTRGPGDMADDRALAVGCRGVVWVLVVCDDGTWGLWFPAGTGIIGGCFEEHLIDREGALGRAGRGSGVWSGIRVARGGERGLECWMWGWEMGAIVDIDVRTATGMELGSD